MNRRNLAVPNTGPPRETGGIDGPARLKSVAIATLIECLRTVNSFVPPAWVTEARRLLDQYQKTSNVKHLRALSRHVAGIHAYMAGLRATTSTEEAAQ
jgi:hypothetical protein